jgi:hypothetical protein
MNKPKYSIEVYENYAIIKGLLTSDMLTILIKLCEEGLTHLTPHQGGGFKLVRKNEKMDRPS